MKKQRSVFIHVLLLVLVIAAGLCTRALSSADFFSTEESQPRIALVIGRDDTNDSKLTGAMIWKTFPDSETIEITPYPSDTVLSKGGSYKGHVYGGKHTLNTLYMVACAWGGAEAAAEVMQQVFLANYDIAIDELIVISSEDFGTLLDYTEIDTTYRIVS